MIIDRVRAERRRPRHRLGRRRRPLLLHRRRAASSATATSSAPCSPARRWPRTPARRSSTTRARAAPCPTWSPPRAAAPTSRRVGHAFFKARMREEGAAFGGEVSGHYYFRDFWNADSGTIPALLMLELLSVDGRSLAELMAEFRSRYFISGEINSEVADPAAKMAEIVERYGDGEQTTPRRDLGRLPRLALQRAPLQHRAAAAPQPRVAGLARGHGGQARRGPRADPGVTPDPRAGAGAGGAGRDPLPAHPHPVRRRAGQLLPARGRAADPDRHRAQLGQGARRAAVASSPSAATRSTTSSWSIVTHQHIDHLGLVEIVVEHSGAEVAAIGVAAERLANFDEDAEAEDRFAVELMLRNGIPEEVTAALQQRLAQLPRLGLARRGDPAARRRRADRLPRPHPAGAPPPRPQPLRHGLLGRGAQDPDRRRPPDRPHLLQPADLAARSTARASARRRSSPTSSRCGRRARCRPRSSSPATASRSSTTSR